jgi:spore coat polysaccharide biosynthesis protein SpsF
MTSTRLPGKVLLPIAGRAMLSYQIERLRRACGHDVLVVATTVNATDDPIVDFCISEGVRCTRGSELDVLSRYCDAAATVGADVVVRVTADCPLIDPDVVEDVIGVFSAARGSLDYVSNMLEPSYPYGMAVEVMSSRALREADAQATSPVDREHVTPFLYRNPQRYRRTSVRTDGRWIRRLTSSSSDASSKRSIHAARTSERATSWRCWSNIHSGELSTSMSGRRRWASDQE